MDVMSAVKAIKQSEAQLQAQLPEPTDGNAGHFQVRAENCVHYNTVHLVRSSVTLSCRTWQLGNDLLHHERRA